MSYLFRIVSGSSIRFETGVTFEEELYVITEGYLRPNFTTREPISVEKMAIASEAACDKLRWEMRSKGQREGSAEEEWEKAEDHIVFDEPNNSLDFAKQARLMFKAALETMYDKGLHDRAPLLI